MDSSIALYISSTSRSRSRYSECKLALLAAAAAPPARAPPGHARTGREGPLVSTPHCGDAPMHVHPSPRALTRHTDMYH